MSTASLSAADYASLQADNEALRAEIRQLRGRLAAAPEGSAARRLLRVKPGSLPRQAPAGR